MQQSEVGLIEITSYRIYIHNQNQQPSSKQNQRPFDFRNFGCNRIIDKEVIKEIEFEAVSELAPQSMQHIEAVYLYKVLQLYVLVDPY